MTTRTRVLLLASLASFMTALDTLVVTTALTTIRLDLGASVELARKLCLMAPDYAPYFHLSGHYEWRCGQHEIGRAHV